MAYSWGRPPPPKRSGEPTIICPALGDLILTQTDNHHKSQLRVDRFNEQAHCLPIDLAGNDREKGRRMSDDTAGPPVPTGPVTLSKALATDGVRRVVLTVSYLFCLVGALAAFGVIDDQPPSLSAVLLPTASLLAPALEGDGLWWVVMVGLGIYAAWMWLPTNADEARGLAVAYPASAAMGLLGVWFFVVRSGDIVIGAFAALAVVAALIRTLYVADRVPSHHFLDRLFTQLGVAVTLGWMSVLTADLFAAALAAHHVRAIWISAETWGILATTALLGFGMALLRYLPGRLYIASAMAWGFVWIAYARVLGQPKAYGVAVVALVSALLVLIAGVAVFLWARGRVRERVS
jgi:hypothetical protein